MKHETPLYLFIMILVWTVSGCRQVESVPVTQAAINDTTSAPIPTLSPTETATPLPTETSAPTDTPAPTFTPTFTPSSTPMPVLTVLVIDEADEAPLEDSIVQLANDDLEFQVEQIADADGEAVFADLVEGMPYTVTVMAEGYLEKVLTVDFIPGESDVTVALETGYFVTVMEDSGSLPGGPAPTTVAAAPIPQPPPAAAAAGNLLTNPSFEAGAAGWDAFNNSALRFYIAPDNPQFVHSGAQSAVIVYGQRWPVYSTHAYNVTPGQTYQAGVWLKVWSSSGEDRTRSENSGDYSARLCIGPNNETDPNKGTSVCTGFVRPLDAWQYLTVDAVAETDTIAVILQSAPLGSNLPAHNEAIWDDASLIIAPSAATPTPEPAGPPVRPEPVPFDAAVLRDNMNNAQWMLEQMGGLLDRLVNGSTEKCAEYEDYYRQLTASPTYHSIPDDWHGVYNEYNFAVENGHNTNSGVFSLCDHGGGGLNQQAYGDARSGVNNSLDRLIPAINMANALLAG